MLKITKQGNSLIVEGVKNGTYPNNGVNEYPLNSLIAVTDDSEMVTFRSAATNDVLFSGKVEDIAINGEKVTKDNILTKFDAVSNASTGGGGGGGSVDAYTKAESDAKYGTKAEQESLRGDVENALGEIAALGYDKADKKDTYTKAEVDEKIKESGGGDVPTLQDGTVGTENNYIYADMSDYTKRVVADMYFKSDKDDVRLMFTPWGAEGPGPDYMIQMDILPEANESEAGIISSHTYKEFKNKQDKLTAGDGITIEDNVISAVGGGGGNTYQLSKQLSTSFNFLPLSEVPYDCEVGDIIIGSNGAKGIILATYISGSIKYITIALNDVGASAKIAYFNAYTYSTYWSLNNEMTIKNYQAVLQSGTNIKTINGESILGSGNIEIQGGGGDVDLSNYPTKQEVNQTYLQKTGTYIKSANGNGGHILFEKGDGQNDSVNFKTINNQGLIGEGNISVPQIWFGTQTEYDALGTYDDNTLYLLREDDGYLTI